MFSSHRLASLLGSWWRYFYRTTVVHLFLRRTLSSSVQGLSSNYSAALAKCPRINKKSPHPPPWRVSLGASPVCTMHVVIGGNAEHLLCRRSGPKHYAFSNLFSPLCSEEWLVSFSFHRRRSTDMLGHSLEITHMMTLEVKPEQVSPGVLDSVCYDVFQ